MRNVAQQAASVHSKRPSSPGNATHTNGHTSRGTESEDTRQKEEEEARTAVVVDCAHVRDRRHGLEQREALERPVGLQQILARSSQRRLPQLLLLGRVKPRQHLVATKEMQPSKTKHGQSAGCLGDRFLEAGASS